MTGSIPAMSGRSTEHGLAELIEELTRQEAAQVLGIAEGAAAKRYIRALKRLKDVLADMPGGLEGI